ncbi:LOW QUALITY PROTEIN: olfactory receptor 10J3-like [Lynx rufus]|uniref:LOW QUALITY PROTEIN: olfactory receptor 10J3-like n=1 Tax=Lynx rufus TaxID=61384 RepID=UPI001F125BDE|nr:LOW QUALITY PROTEIN: olfactory receptor 10J3-like [Lynx rufus]
MYCCRRSVSRVGGCDSQKTRETGCCTNNCFLLTATGYDCYVTTRNPLRYSVVMSKEACVQLASGSLGTGLGVATVQVTSVFGLPFCDALVIFHFFCDVRPLLKLACVDTPVNEIVNFVVSVCVLILPTGPVFFSYVLIVSTSLKIPSARGRKKAFATCTSRLRVVIVHYGCASVAYLKPKSRSSLWQDRLISVTYTPHSPAEPCRVQPEEQGGQGCPAQSRGAEAPFLLTRTDYWKAFN